VAGEYGGTGSRWGRDRSDGESHTAAFTLDYKRRIVREAITPSTTLSASGDE
jgi:hypothetical protein